MYAVQSGNIFTSGVQKTHADISFSRLFEQVYIEINEDQGLI